MAHRRKPLDQIVNQVAGDHPTGVVATDIDPHIGVAEAIACCGMFRVTNFACRECDPGCMRH